MTQPSPEPDQRTVDGFDAGVREMAGTRPATTSTRPATTSTKPATTSTRPVTTRVLVPWVVIVGVGFLASWLGLPVAWLVGPMIATVVLVLTGHRPLPNINRAFPWVQAVIGATFSASFTLDALAPLRESWLAILATVFLVLGLSVWAGVVLTRVARLDVATASLGTVPGGASGMVAMSEDLGGDVRLVAFMQYARLVVVVLSISVLASVVGPGEAPVDVVATGTDTPMLGRYALAIAVSAIGGWLGVKSRLPAGALVGPMVVGIVPGLLGIGPLAWPGWVLAGAYLLLGVLVGCRFDRAVLGRMWSLLPWVLGFVVALTIACAGIGWALHAVTGLDLLSSLLATSPGGMDAATIAAIDTGANVTMVASIQMIRLLLMVLLGPVIIRHLVRRGGTQMGDRRGPV